MQYDSGYCLCKNRIALVRPLLEGLGHSCRHRENGSSREPDPDSLSHDAQGQDAPPDVSDQATGSQLKTVYAITC